MVPFLRENKLKNSREWYFSHKEDYKKLVYEPFADFVKSIAPQLAAIDKLIVTEPRYCLCHIYRDTRFTKDKSTLYRENMWQTYKRPAKVWKDAPSFYFEVTPSVIRWGMGYWAVEASSMSLFRSYLLKYPEEFEKKISKLKTMRLESDRYKKKFKKEAPAGLEDWYLSKNIHLTDSITDFEQLYDGSVAQRVIKGFKETAELYRLMYEIKDMPQLVEDEPKNSIPINNVSDFEW